MALDFPSSPTNGQTYGNYYYDATIGAWNSFSSSTNTLPSTLKNLSVTTDDIALTPLTITGASGQTANLQNWKNSAGTIVASINNAGVVSADTLNLVNDLTVINGGTGAGTFTTGAYLKGNGTSAIQAQTGIPLSDVTVISIGAAADLNTYVTQGIYHQSANVNAAGGANYPVPYAGLLEVFQSGVDGSGFTYQRYTVYKEQLAAYTRAKYTTTWSGWQREGTQAEIIALVPAGTVVQTAGSSAPTGWLLCDGTEKAIATYPNLYAVLGTTYGTLTNGAGAAGTTHFRVPDTRGRVPMGSGTGAGDGSSGSNSVPSGTALTARTLGSWGGAQTHTLTASELAPHYHAIYTKNDDFNSTSGGTAVGPTFHNAVDGTTTLNRFTDIVRQMTTTAGVDVAGGSAHNNIQPYIVMNYIIKV